MENYAPQSSISTTDLSDALPPALDVTGIVIALGLGYVLVSLAITMLILWCCRSKRKKPVPTDFHPWMNNATLIAIPPTHDRMNNAVQPTHAMTSNTRVITLSPESNSVQVWEVDAATMERFLHDIAREKPVRFTSQQICSFTRDYSKKLGSGGFGIVYKGRFPNGMKIAVKILNRSDKSVEEQFMAEVGTIGRTYHINLVRLYGFCFDQATSALIYEYMENGSLDKFIFRNTKVIEFDTLLVIAIGTAKGLAYLHEECLQRIVHYDIKPGNVLLDSNFSPKVADFGLAKLCNRDNSHDSSTGYRGTPGYSAPEFLLKNHPITYKCDVYSFGILLFEIVGQRKHITSNSTDASEWFPMRVWTEYKKGGLVKMIAECGIKDEDREKAERMFLVALWCVQDSPEERPLMSNVVKMLEGGLEIMPPPRPFKYFYSDVALPRSESGSSSSYSTSQYTDATPVMRKHGIGMARSSRASTHELNECS